MQNRRARDRQALRVDDADVVPGVVEQIGEGIDQTVREHQHVEEQRPDHGDADRREHSPGAIAANRAPGEPRRGHRPTSVRMSRRSSVQDAPIPAPMPSGTAIASARIAIDPVTRTKTSVVSYRAWKTRLTIPSAA